MKYFIIRVNDYYQWEKQIELSEQDIKALLKAEPLYSLSLEECLLDDAQEKIGRILK